jgi:hypothetical protein
MADGVVSSDTSFEETPLDRALSDHRIGYTCRQAEVRAKFHCMTRMAAANFPTGVPWT